MTIPGVENLLNTIEYFVFMIRPSGQVIAVNPQAYQLLRIFSHQKNLIQELFDLKNYDHALDLANSHQKRDTKVVFSNGNNKTLRCEFTEGKNGIVCTAVNINSIQELLQNFNNEYSIYKKILLNIFPKYIVDELVSKKTVHPKVYRHCTILFTDVVDFSILTFHLDPVSLIRRLDSYFSLYDNIMDEYGIEKIKTIGDSYMCVSGLPVKKNSHSVDCCLAALKILHSMEETKKPENIVDNIDLNNWSIRIGIHTGPCISGVVGVKKYSFDIWGDSVNIASRMQMSGVPGRINISESTYKEVKDFFNCSFRDNMEIKNIGSVGMYFLNRIKTRFSEDGPGFYPNKRFKQNYYKKFWGKDSKSDLSVLPTFIEMPPE